MSQEALIIRVYRFVFGISLPSELSSVTELNEAAQIFHAVLIPVWTYMNNFFKSTVQFQNLSSSWRACFFSPTVVDGCTDAALSRDFCFLSLSFSLRRWQRWWWWWWWALSWPWTCPVEDWATSGCSRSYSLRLNSWRCCCVSEDAERLIGLRSTIGWEGKRNMPRREEKEEQRDGCGVFLPKLLVLDHQNIHDTQMTQPVDSNLLS